MSLRKFEKFDESGFEPAVSTLEPDADGTITISDAALLFDAQFQRLGDDLYLHNAGEPSLRIPDYFAVEAPADLYAPNKSVLRGDVIERLAGPEAPAQYAQAGPGGAASGPIGQVETISGNAWVQHSDGTEVRLDIGVKILANDVVRTDNGASVSITFVDGTIFTLSANSTMVIDELIYDPDSTVNSGGFSLVQGSFVFIAGQVAKTGGMQVDTPSATMGIRGTSVVVHIQAVNGVITSEVSLTTDPDGGRGEIILFDTQGNVIANITDINSKWVITADDGAVREEPRTLTDDAEDNLLIAEAVAAYQSAFERVEAGQTFVTFGSQNSREPGLPSPGTSGQDLDSIDDPTGIEPGQDGLDGDEDGGEGFDEGRLRIEFELSPEDIQVTGLEDSGAGDIGGVIVAGEGEILYAIVTGPANGFAEIFEDGNFTYTPNPNFNGIDSFTYSATAPTGEVETATVTVNVLPVNDAPLLGDSAVVLAEDGQVAGAVTAADIDGDALSYSIETPASQGAVVLLADGTFVYTPNPDYVGTDSFEIRVIDTGGLSDTALVSVTVTGESDPPVIVTPAGQDSGAVTEGAAADFAAGQLAATDADAGAVLTWTGSAAGTYGSFEIAADGAWTYSLDNAAADSLVAGEVVDETFVATVTDDEGLTAQQLVTVTITGTNDGPRITSTTADAAGAVTEGAEFNRVGGQLAAADPDQGGSVGWSGSAAGLYGAFVIAADGAWSYTLDNAAAESLSAGQTVTETFTATVTDNLGAVATEDVVITITGTNDNPVVTREIVIETAPGDPVSGQLAASDADSAGALGFALGAAGPANGSAIIDADGGYTYTPDPGFQGIDRFEYTVTDSDGGVSTATVTVEVVNASGTGGDGQAVSVEINTEATADAPAGSVTVTAVEASATAINLVFALDRSGSIGSNGWAAQTEAVADAIDLLAAQFAGSTTQVDVKIITYASDVTELPTADLQDPGLSDDVRALIYSAGATNWTDTFFAVEDFLSAEPVDESNFLFFVTDGDPSSGTWVSAFDQLTDVAANGFTLNVEAFGIGNSINFANLEVLDPTPTTLTSAEDLADALVATPIFSPELSFFEMTLEVDGVDQGVIADENAPALVADGLNYQLALAEIDGIETLLGDSNRFNVRVGFDLDGDAATTEVELFTTEVFAAATTAQVLTGLAESDLLVGSVAGDVIGGGGGADLILGYGGGDRLDGGAGADVVLAGGGDDILVVSDLPGAEEILDGGDGRDVLEIGIGGDLNGDLLPSLSLSDIEAIDIENGQANSLQLTLDDVLGLSSTADSDLEALLGEALPESATIYGDSGDMLTLVDGADGGFEAETGGPVSDGEGNSLIVYNYMSGGNVLATVAVDADVTVNSAPAA